MKTINRPVQATLSPRGNAIQRLRNLITSGPFGPGERLPSEQALANMVQVSRGTLRAALEDLERQGLVSNEKYRGRRVAESARSASLLLADTIVLLRRSDDGAEGGQGHSGYMAAIDDGVAEAVHEAGLHVLVLQPNGRQQQLFEDVMRDRPRGILITHKLADSQVGREILHRLKQARIPFVLNGDGAEVAEYDRVVSDHEAGAYAATRWLIEQGCQRILRVWQLRGHPYWLEARDAGYQRAIREAGLDPLPAVRMEPADPPRDSYDRKRAFELRTRQVAGFLVEHLTANPGPDAIMAGTDGIIFALAAACRLFGRTPGQDLLFAGYDNYFTVPWEREFESATPDVTVDKHNRETGRQMMKLLTDRIQGRLPEAPQRVVLAPEMIVVPK